MERALKARAAPIPPSLRELVTGIEAELRALRIDELEHQQWLAERACDWARAGALELKLSSLRRCWRRG